ncbi:MAG: outer membrane beta-barrel protein [Rhodospirillales bacterium]|nr:outer membrane beta-barrel protein [Rhodospirillales bacterium]
MLNPSRWLAVLMIAALALAAPVASRAASVPEPVSRQLSLAAQSGPVALLDSLAQALAAHPELAATPDAAAALARVASAPVPDFVGANLPVYREIAARIIAAAPAAQRDAVRLAVGRELASYVANDIRIMPALPPAPAAPPQSQPPEVGGRGFDVGSFTIYPEVHAGGFYDSNIYATNTAAKSDWVGTLSPSVAVQSNWDRNSLYAEAGTDLTGYVHHGSENTADWHTQLEGQIDLSKNTHILLGGILLQEHEDRASPDTVEGTTPTLYHEMNAYGGVVHRIGDFDVRLAGAVQRLTFGNVMGTNGLIFNHDRNRNRYTFGVTVRDVAYDNFRPFVEGLGDIRVYDQSTDEFGYQRDSNGYRAGVGAQFRLAPSLTGEAFLGAMGRDYKDPTFKPVTTVAADGYLRWQAAQSTAFVLFMDRSIEETTLSGSPAYVYTVAGARIEHAFLDDLTGFVRFAYANAAFAQSSRQDNEFDTSVGLRYYVTKRVYLGADYRFTSRRSSEATQDFARNQVFFTVGSSF